MTQKRGSRRYSSKRKKRNLNENGVVVGDDGNTTNTNSIGNDHPGSMNINGTQAYYWDDNVNMYETNNYNDTVIVPQHRQQNAIPSPLSIDEFMNISSNITLSSSLSSDHHHDDASNKRKQLLFSIWKAIQNNNHHDSSITTQSKIIYHHPTPIQLQAWSILLQIQEQQQPSPSTISLTDYTTSEGNDDDDHHHHDSHMKGDNLILIAPTGSGKTFAYSIPLIIHCYEQFKIDKQRQQQKKKKGYNKNPLDTTLIKKSTSIQGIVLVPTRELAIQVQTTISEIISTCTTNTDTKTCDTIFDLNKMHVAACYGGNNNTKKSSNNNTSHYKSYRTDQIEEIVNATIITATPGRLLDLLSQQDNNKDDQQQQEKESSLVFTNLHTVIIDEADRMAIHTDLNEQTKQILQLICCTNNHNDSSVQHHIRMILCSATWPNHVTTIWKEWIQTCTRSDDTNNRSTIVVTVDAISIQSSKRKKVESTSDLTQPTIDLSTTRNEDASLSNALTNDNTQSTTETTEKDELITNEKKHDPTHSMIISRIPSHIIQTIHVCAEHKKMKKLLHTLDTIYTKNVNKDAVSSQKQIWGIIFFNKIKTVEQMHTFIKKQRPNITNTMTLHSQLHQSIRENVWNEFIQGKISILFATDVAARGIHTSNIQFVINYDFPSNIEQYIHRCGRAGRNTNHDATATIYSFFTRNLAPLANDLIQLLEANQQFVDPNLRALLPKQHGRPAKDLSKQKDSHINQSKIKVGPDVKNDDDDGTDVVKKDNGNEDDPNDDDDDYNDEKNDPFLQRLSPKRIVLSRASHISDASASDESSADE